MFAWLNGPGSVFREPLPGSTNYMGAYDREGNLTRLRNQDTKEEEEGKNEEVELDENGNPVVKDGGDELLALQEEEASLSEAERQQRKEQREMEAEEEKESRNRGGLPKEKARDLRPFPLNDQFRSQPVLSDELREELCKQVVEGKQSVATVSAVYGVDMRRVAAVVRLKTVEKDWISQGKKLATSYQSAVLAMVPQTPFTPGGKIIAHESINDLPVHPHTHQQIFYPTSESRQFTRVDAAKVFSPTLLPADDRIPHPQLIELERETAAQVSRDDRKAKIRAKDEADRLAKEAQEERQRLWEARNIQKVQGQRWQFKFQNVSVDMVGKDGRGHSGVGWRYGAPHTDRKRGQVKIPTSVE